MAAVLIIDDDVQTCDIMAMTVGQMSHTAVCAHDLHTGLAQLRHHPFDVVLLDVNLPDGSGLDLLPEIRCSATVPEVIIITGAGNPDGAELAIQNGAWDYLSKPLRPSNLMLTLNRVLQYRLEKVKASVPMLLDREGIIGNSPKLKHCLALTAKAASMEGNVLITGETGTGKELFARAIHRNSARSQGPFVVVDCGALPETLVESILFGYEKGAFTTAIAARDGLARKAHGGTLFLDEIGELPMGIQSAFLRLLQERSYRPVGAGDEVKTNIRLITATNRNLEQMVAQNKFRKDLFFRVTSTVIDLPPLRQRCDDLPELITFYVGKLCEQYAISTKIISPEFVEALKSYSWPGNLRELINVLEQSIHIMISICRIWPA